MAAEDWKREALQTTSRECFHCHPHAARAAMDPKLQRSNLRIGGGGTEGWSTTSGSMHAVHACCTCVGDQGKQHATD
jgi:hypothetical protein